jgi:hypothetical protein
MLNIGNGSSDFGCLISLGISKIEALIVNKITLTTYLITVTKRQ